MAARDEHLEYLLALYVLENHNKKRKKRVWTKDWLLKRADNTHVNIKNLLEELRAYPNDFNNFLRMDEETYLKLLQSVSPLMERQSTAMREPISPHERLTVTLRFLATGRKYQDLRFSSRISQPAHSMIIPETCSAIFSTLVTEYLKFPTKEDEWLQQAQMFEDRWQFPNCLGAVDGKHVAITAPRGCGSYFYNYKGFHSMVLMAIANANYEFIYVYFGTNGRVSDGGVIDGTDFHQMLSTDSLKLPAVNQSNGLTYVFVADEAFALRKDFLKPYNVKLLDNEKRIYNYRLSRARRVVENVFGIMVSRFGVLQSEINLKPQNIDKVVLACCVLYNYLRRNATTTYTPSESLDYEDPITHQIQNGHRSGGDRIADLSVGLTRNSSEEAKRVRDHFKLYFNTVGKVPWQDKVL